MEKNKILLLNFPPATTYKNYHQGTIFPSTAILLLGTILNDAGYQVAIIDGAYDDRHPELLQDYLIKNNDSILFIGMSVMTTQVPFALAASKAIKEFNKDITVVWGGPHPTLFPEATLKNDNIDIVAINEAASTVIDLADCLTFKRNLATVRGIGYKNIDTNNVSINPSGFIDDIDKVPFFDFSLISVENYLNPPSGSVFQREFPYFKKKLKILPILTGLGCPFRCQFCINVILKRKYRFRKAESIVNEIKYLQEKYGANTFLFLDEDFFISKKRIFDLLDLVEKEKLHFNWRMWCRVDHFREDYLNRRLIQRLENIGYGSLVMGAESGNQDILDSLKKGIKTDQTLRSLELLSSSKIFPRYSFIVGLENENMAHIKNTYNFAMKLKRINPRVDIDINTFRLYPGSPIYDRLTSSYDIPVPQDLESWAEHLIQEETFTEIPWTPWNFQKNSELFNFYANHALKSLAGSPLNAKSFMKLLLQRIARFRLKRFLFNFPFEYRLLNTKQPAA